MNTKSGQGFVKGGNSEREEQGDVEVNRVVYKKEVDVR